MDLQLVQWKGVNSCDGWLIQNKATQSSADRASPETASLSDFQMNNPIAPLHPAKILSESGFTLLFYLIYRDSHIPSTSTTPDSSPGPPHDFRRSFTRRPIAPATPNIVSQLFKLPPTLPDTMATEGPEPTEIMEEQIPHEEGGEEEVRIAIPRAMSLLQRKPAPI